MPAPWESLPERLEQLADPGVPKVSQSRDAMPQQKTDHLRPPADPRRVSLDGKAETLYWTDRFSVSEDRLRAAVEKVGRDVDAVAQELEGQEGG